MSPKFRILPLFGQTALTCLTCGSVYKPHETVSDPVKMSQIFSDIISEIV